METKNAMEIEKKVYTAPEIIDHGNLIELTLGAGNTGNFDPDFEFQSGPWLAPPQG